MYRVMVVEYDRKPQPRVTLLAGDFASLAGAKGAADGHCKHEPFHTVKEGLNVSGNLGPWLWKRRSNMVVVYESRTGDVVAGAELKSRGQEGPGSA